MMPALLAAAILLQAQAPERADLLRAVEAKAERFGEVSRRIWEFAEVGYKETRSAALLKDELRAAGFRIEENVAAIPTAFSATWGSGKPVIGILGEYDALPGLSQEAAPEKKPREGVTSGHGCGHNLFGAGSALAAVALKEHLEARKTGGTVRFYGCPAEEGGGGKIYIARAGAFADSDAVLAWHPGTENRSSLQSNLANITAKFRYHGTAAHAAGSPEKGRSALDAVALMTHAVDLLREHVPQATRLHYVITNGGDAPNVVPAFAEVYLYARHPDMEALDGIWARIRKCADAGALATETKLDVELVNSAYNILPNDALARLVDRNLREVGGVEYTDEERAFAESLRRTFPGGDAPPLDRARQVMRAEEGVSSGSTDVGDVSWVVPTINFRTATFVPGTPGHSWQATACSGSTIGRKGMVVAAKALALSALDLLTTPAEVAAARESFEKRRAGRDYRSRLPVGQKPPLNYRDK
jgi:aminobenzoyl-glutamate utilization protein B